MHPWRVAIMFGLVIGFGAGLIAEAVAAALRDPAIRDRLVGQGMNLLASSPEELGRFLDPQMARWAGVVREYGIRAGD